MKKKKNGCNQQRVTRRSFPMHRAFCAGYTSRAFFFFRIFVNAARHLHFAFRVLYDFFRSYAPPLAATYNRIYIYI